MKSSTVLSVVINLMDEDLIKFNYQSILQILGYKPTLFEFCNGSSSLKGWKSSNIWERR